MVVVLGFNKNKTRLKQHSEVKINEFAHLGVGF